VAATPEYGKELFHQRMRRELEHVKGLYAQAHRTGVADGSEGNWTSLRPHSEDACIDFCHASAYLDWVAKAKHPRQPAAREGW
jgi:hypothetical protein